MKREIHIERLIVDGSLSPAAMRAALTTALRRVERQDGAALAGLTPGVLGGEIATAIGGARSPGSGTARRTPGKD